MKERLLQLLDLEQLSPSKFADIIGVQRSSVSHVISGRNKPSFDFLQKTLTAFPGLNASWLMMGDGSMYEQMGRSTSVNLFDTVNTASEDAIPADIPDQDPENEQREEGEAVIPPMEEMDQKPETAPGESLVHALTGSKKRIVQLMVIYEDDTFRAFSPAH